MKIDRDLTRPSDRWFSDRGIPLITQPLGLPKMTECILSVERYEKWYSIFIANPVTLEVKELNVENDPAYAQYSRELDIWRDHTIVPDDFVQLAKAGGYKIDLQTYDAVCRRYIQDWVSRNAVFTKEFCDDIGWEYTGDGYGKSFDPNDYPSYEDLQSVLVDHDVGLII
ncbi:MAG: hypothetical protein NC311_05620 [Muribaculaceae bacterium]|nr:hypothetical protein [Muribaculaceae bacterium]